MKRAIYHQMKSTRSPGLHQLKIKELNYSIKGEIGIVCNLGSTTPFFPQTGPNQDYDQDQT